MLTCITRSMNDELYDMMLSLCPNDWKFIKVVGSTAHGYLDYIFNNKFDTKWILNLDEDCFLINHDLISGLIKFLEDNKFDYCGIQDGGSIPVRIHNPIVSNPFFNLFNTDKIYPLDKDYDKRNYNLEVLMNKYSKFIRFTDGNFKFDRYEKFYNHFFWLLENGLRPYFNEAKEFSKEKYFVYTPLLRIIPYFNSPTMICNQDGQELALHTWHSRYMNHSNIRKRIINCYNYARKSSTLFNKDIQVVHVN